MAERQPAAVHPGQPSLRFPGHHAVPRHRGPQREPGHGRRRHHGHGRDHEVAARHLEPAAPTRESAVAGNSRRGDDGAGDHHQHPEKESRNEKRAGEREQRDDRSSGQVSEAEELRQCNRPVPREHEEGGSAPGQEQRGEGAGEKEKVRHGAAGTRGGGGGTTAEQYDARSGRGRPWITVSRAPTSTDRASSTAPAGSYRMTAPYGAPGS